MVKELSECCGYAANSLVDEFYDWSRYEGGLCFKETLINSRTYGGKKMSKNGISVQIDAVGQFENINGELGIGLQGKTSRLRGDMVRALRGVSHKTIEYVKGIFGIIVFLLLWEVCSRLGVIDNIFIPPFSKICVSLWKLLKSGELGYHAYISLWRALMGLSLGVAVALPLGMLVGQIPIVERFLDPVLQTFRQTSTLALVPVFILMLGLGETSKVVMIFWGVSWPILLSTISGVKSVDPLFIKAAKSMNESLLGIFVKIIVPAALPHIFTGVRLGATAAIMLLIVAEMVGASSGLGFLIYDYQVKYQISDMFAIIVVFSILGLLLNYVLVVLEKRIIKWKPETA